MAKLMPLGERVIVEEVIPTDDLTARGAAFGLKVIVEEGNKPRPTEGVVKAVGPGPLVSEYIQVGDHIFFGPHAGMHTWLEGKKYRTLEYHEITSVLKEEPTTSENSGSSPQPLPDPGTPR